MRSMDLFRLDGKVAIVTGGSQGLGLAMAEGLAEAGASVVVCARHVDEAEEAAGRLARCGAESLAVRCDVSVARDVAGLVDATVQRFGRIDVLLNNAGYAWEEPFEQLSQERWDRTFAVNATGTFLCSQAAGKQMIAQGGGKIVNVLSVVALRSPDPEVADSVPYSAAKGAVWSMTRDLARKWSRHRINVNAIIPGYFPTRMSRYLVEHRLPQVLASIPMKRIAEMHEIKGAALFLASSASDYVTGAAIPVDGGLLT